MNTERTCRVAGLLGVGFDQEEKKVRITKAETYKVFMGTAETHTNLQKMCRDIIGRAEAGGRKLQDFTPDELIKLMREMY